MTMIRNVPTQLVDAWTRLHRAKENYEALTREVDNFLYEYVKGMIKGWNPEGQRLFSSAAQPRLCDGGEAGGSWIRQRVVVVRKRRRGPWLSDGTCAVSDRWGFSAAYSRASWKVSVRIKAPAARGGLRTASRGRHADRPFDEPATSTARRHRRCHVDDVEYHCGFNRAYAVVPARRSRWSRGASRTSSAPAAGSARHRADAGRGAARSPDAQPASCRRSFP